MRWLTFVLGQDLAQTQWSISIWGSHGVDFILQHDDEGVTKGRQLHQVLDSSGPVRSVELVAFRGVQAQSLSYKFAVRVGGKPDAAAEDHFT